ncbi:PspC domain-containing protein [Georgenia daeguensis]|uniref:Phage shock protein PspC N-terminal domain-containing protein n=1 Tax=Georgenia daeguensis TaxID=908355 RepID=A0ABP8EUS1_9MICO
MTTNDSSPEPGRPDRTPGDRPHDGGPAPFGPQGGPAPSGPQGGPAYTGPLGGPPPQPPPAWVGQPRQESTAGFFDSLRRTGIWRGQDRWIGGVAAGIARRLDVDPLLVRGILVVMSFFGGLGLLLYGLGWALLPEESDGRIHLQEALRGNVDAALAGAVAFAVIGISRPGTWWGGWDYRGGGWFLFGLAVVAVVLIVVAAFSRRGSGRPPAAPPGAEPGPGPQGWTAPPPPAAPAAWTEARSDAEPTTAYGRAAYGDPAPAPQRPGAAPATGYAPAYQATAHQAPAYQAPAYQAPSGYDPTAYPATAAYQGAPAPAPYPTQPLPPVPPRPRTPGPGSAVVAVVLALCLLTTAALLMWDLTDPQGWLLPVTIGGSILLLLGLGVMVSALRGRRGGALAILGVLLALVVVPATLASTVAPFHEGLSTGAGFGDRSFTPATAGSAAAGYQLVAGDLDVDLSEVDLSGGPVTVPLELGAGDLSLVVPADAAVRIEAELGAGRIEGRTQAGWSGPMSSSPSDSSGPVVWADGNAIDATFLSPAAQEDDAELVVQIRAGAGNIHIEEQQ